MNKEVLDPMENKYSALNRKVHSPNHPRTQVFFLKRCAHCLFTETLIFDEPVALMKTHYFL